MIEAEAPMKVVKASIGGTINCRELDPEPHLSEISDVRKAAVARY